MDFPKKDLSTLANRLLSGDSAPEWKTPNDLERISFESFVSEFTLGRQLHSSGSIRLTGDGVREHSASLESLGMLMSRVQRLVSAIGGAEKGFKKLRGRLPSSVLNETRLNLNAGALPGSVFLEFEPAMPPNEALYYKGVVPLFGDEQETLVDKSVKRAIDLMTNASNLGPDSDGSEFLDEISILGPRAASALAEVASTVSSACFDFDIEWREPNHPTYRSFFSAGDAERIVKLVSARELDSETDVIVGSILTISDISQIHVKTDDGELVSIKPGKIDHEDLSRINHGQRVLVSVDVKISQRAGDSPTALYLGRSIKVAGN